MHSSLTWRTYKVQSPHCEAEINVCLSLIITEIQCFISSTFRGCSLITVSVISGVPVLL